MKRRLFLFLAFGILIAAGCGKKEPPQPEPEPSPSKDGTAQTESKDSVRPPADKDRPRPPAGPSKAEAEAHLKKLQGSWFVVAVEARGLASDEGKDQQFVVLGERFNIKDPAGRAIAFGSFQIDPHGEVQKLDVTYARGPHKGKTAPAIYALEGDTLKICLAAPGADRPLRLAATQDAAPLLTLKRQRDPALLEASRLDLQKMQGAWVVVAVEEDGTAVASKGQQFIVFGERFNLRDAAGKILSHGTCKLGGSGANKTLDLVHAGEAPAGETVRALYAFDGDRLKLCLPPAGVERPAEFASRAESGVTLQVLQRAESLRPEAELNRLQGVWKVTAVEEKGKPAPAGKVRHIVFLDDQFNLKDADGNVLAYGSYRVDPDRKSMDLTQKEGPQKDQTALALYALEGDSLRICLAPTGESRPASLASSPDSRASLLRLEREKP